MNIGIVSIHSAHNYGSVLQAYALQEVLKKYSSKVDMINYRPHYLNCQYNLFSIRVYKRYKGFFNKILHFGWRIIMLPRRIEKYYKFEHFILNNMNLTKKYKSYEQLCNENFNYDLVVVGSDQVWNTDITEGFDKTYYLGFLNNNIKKASYAASIGKSSLDKQYESLYKKYINQLDCISLRERSNVKTLKFITEKNIHVSLDPTLLLEKKKWIEISNKSNLKIDNEKYIFVYILQENIEFVKIVNELSKKLNLKVYSISKKKRFNNEKIFPNAGPEDFLKLCNNSEFVVTNSFHGTVFSLIFEKRNCIIPHLHTGSRMIDLMNLVGLKNRIVENYKNLDVKNILKNINYNTVNQKLNTYRIESLKYIEGVIDEK